jgi:hypothetical protein
MTLKDLMQSVNETEFRDNKLFLQLREVKPGYGSNIRISVRKVGDRVVVTNVHVGSHGDIVSSPIDIAADIHLTDTELLSAILDEMANERFTDTDSDEFWDDMMDLQKAKIIR